MKFDKRVNFILKKLINEDISESNNEIDLDLLLDDVIKLKTFENFKSNKIILNRIKKLDEDTFKKFLDLFFEKIVKLNSNNDLNTIYFYVKEISKSL